jgi:hypothetical protein
MYVTMYASAVPLSYALVGDHRIAPPQQIGRALEMNENEHKFGEEKLDAPS